MAKSVETKLLTELSSIADGEFKFGASLSPKKFDVPLLADVEMTPPRFIVRDLIEVAGLHVIDGIAGVGKSIFTLRLIEAMLGFGSFPPFDFVQENLPVGILVVDSEGNNVKTRLRYPQAGEYIRYANLIEINDVFTYKNLLQLIKENSDEHWFVVVDNIGAGNIKIEDNAESRVFLKEILEVAKNRSVLIVLHKKKTALQKASRDSFLGATSFLNFPRGFFSLYEGLDNDNLIYFHIVKLRNAAKPTNSVLVFERVIENNTVNFVFKEAKKPRSFFESPDAELPSYQGKRFFQKLFAREARRRGLLIEDISKFFGVSKRTVQYWLDEGGDDTEN